MGDSYRIVGDANQPDDSIAQYGTMEDMNGAKMLKFLANFPEMKTLNNREQRQIRGGRGLDSPRQDGKLHS